MRTAARCRWRFNQRRRAVTRTQLGVKIFAALNLPFSEWTTMIPNVRLCKAMVDRLTDRAHIIETGTESYRFRRTLAKSKGAKA
jgi:DNA replication protein DnaC